MLTLISLSPPLLTVLYIICIMFNPILNFNVLFYYLYNGNVQYYINITSKILSGVKSSQIFFFLINNEYNFWLFPSFLKHYNLQSPVTITIITINTIMFIVTITIILTDSNKVTIIIDIITAAITGAMIDQYRNHFLNSTNNESNIANNHSNTMDNDSNYTNHPSRPLKSPPPPLPPPPLYPLFALPEQATIFSPFFSLQATVFSLFSV